MRHVNTLKHRIAAIPGHMQPIDSCANKQTERDSLPSKKRLAHPASGRCKAYTIITTNSIISAAATVSKNIAAGSVVGTRSFYNIYATLLNVSVNSMID